MFGYSAVYSESPECGGTYQGGSATVGGGGSGGSGGGNAGSPSVSPTSGITAAQAHDPETAANYAAMELDSDMTTLAAKFPNFTAAQLLQATAAAYNFGTGNISGNPNTIDVGTAGGNYGSNVVQLMTCFHWGIPMVRSRIGSHFRVMTALVFFAMAVRPAQAQDERASAASRNEDSLKTFLRGYLRGEDTTTRFSVASVHLKGEGSSQAIVYVMGKTWCGSGGCLTLILDRRDSSYRVVGRVPISRLPIRVLESS
jgi:hypothetical protein